MRALYIGLVMKGLRCLLGALLLLVIWGGSALAVGQDDDLIQPTIQTSMGQSMPSDCSRCDGSDMGRAATCSALGTCMPGVIALSEYAIPQVGSIDYPSGAEHISGLKGSPEPLPPRADILA